MTSKISVIIPVFNEAGTLEEVYTRLQVALQCDGTYEIIFVNDGSTDGSSVILDKIARRDPDIVKVVHLLTNRGKAAALQTGFDIAQGELIAMMDADLQDQPEELTKLVLYLQQENLDAVTGWKINRQDPWTKTMPSKCFNYLMNWFSGLAIHDFNCGLKVFRRKCLSSFRLYGQLHRFILIFIAHNGFKVGELPVTHAPRQSGISKYGAKRFYYGLMDLLTVFFITRYLESPLYFFGFYGIIAMILATVCGGFFCGAHFLSFIVLSPDWRLANHPIWVLSPILFLLGLIMIFFGLLGELLTYYLLTAAKSSAYYQPTQRRNNTNIYERF